MTAVVVAVVLPVLPHGEAYALYSRSLKRPISTSLNMVSSIATLRLCIHSYESFIICRCRLWKTPVQFHHRREMKHCGLCDAPVVLRSLLVRCYYRFCNSKRFGRKKLLQLHRPHLWKWSLDLHQLISDWWRTTTTPMRRRWQKKTWTDRGATAVAFDLWYYSYSILVLLHVILLTFHPL